MGPTALARGHRLELEPTQTRLIARPIESRSPRDSWSRFGSVGATLGIKTNPESLWASQRLSDARPLPRTCYQPHHRPLFVVGQVDLALDVIPQQRKNA